MHTNAATTLQVLLLASQASAFALPNWAKLGRRQFGLPDIGAIIDEIDLPINAPEVIEHVGLDPAAAKDLLASLSSAFPPAPTPDVPADARRRSAPSERRQSSPITSTGSDAPADSQRRSASGSRRRSSPVTSSASDAAGPALSERQDSTNPFIAITNSDTTCGQVTINGPFTSIQMFVGEANVLRIVATDMEGKTSDISAGDAGIHDSGVFTFAPNERITEMVLYANEDGPSGFRFKTDGDNEYKALGTNQEVTAPDVSVGSLGSGVIGRIRASPCDTGILGSFSFDFLDELESIAISNIAYSGFTNNIMPAGPGQALTVGSQAINNINGSVSQTTNIQTQDAMVKQRSITVTDQWNIGGSVSVKAEVGIPLVTKGEVTATANWGFQRSTADTELEGQTIQRSTVVALTCPARKFCLGTSFVTIFSLDVNIEATFRAKTKAGATWEWTQSGNYKGADSFALELQVDESDTPLSTAPTVDA